MAKDTPAAFLMTAGPAMATGPGVAAWTGAGTGRVLGGCGGGFGRVLLDRRVQFGQPRLQHRGRCRGDHESVELLGQLLLLRPEFLQLPRGVVPLIGRTRSRPVVRLVIKQVRRFVRQRRRRRRLLGHVLHGDAVAALAIGTGGGLAPDARRAGDLAVAGRGGFRCPACGGRGSAGGLGGVAAVGRGRLGGYGRGGGGGGGRCPGGRGGDGDVEAEVAAGLGVEAGKKVEQALFGVLERQFGEAEGVAGGGGLSAVAGARPGPGGRFRGSGGLGRSGRWRGGRRGRRSW